MQAHNTARHAAQFALEKKGEDVIIMDVRGLSNATDFFVIVSAASDVQINAIATNIEKMLRKDFKIHINHKEGTGSSAWVLLDYIDVLVHVFHKDKRGFYGLEELWADAKFETVTDKPDEH